MKKTETSYRNHTLDPQHDYVPLVCPRPVFDSPQEKWRYEAAVHDNPRRDGEDIIAWLDRVCSAARDPKQPLLGDRELPLSDRVPGEDG